MDRQGFRHTLAANMCKIALLYISSAGVPLTIDFLCRSPARNLTAADVKV